jgi:anaphase-promoting complex subunit 3
MYMKRNKMRLAEYHYRKALEINPHNAVVLGCMGLVSRCLLYSAPSLPSWRPHI